MNKKETASSHPLRIFLCGVILMTLAGIALRALNLLLYYEAEIGYYKADAVLPAAMNIFFLAVFAVIGVCSIIIPKKPYATSGNERNIAVVISSALCAIAFLSLSVCALLGLVQRDSALTYILVITTLLAAVYFVLGALGKNNNARAILMIAIVAALSYILAVSYFDVFVQMNSPNKTLTQLACLASMLFFVYEARAAVGEKKSKLYVFSLSCALFFSGITAFPAIAAYLSGNLGNYFININYILFDALLAVLFVYFAVRLITLMVTADRKDEETDLGEYEDMYVFPEDADAEEEIADISDFEEESPEAEDAEKAETDNTEKTTERN